MDASYSQQTDSLIYYSKIVSNPVQKNDLARAYRFFTHKKNKSSRDHIPTEEVYANQHLADIQYNLGYYRESERLNLESLKLLDQIPPGADELWINNTKIKILNDLGKNHANKKDFKEALKIYDKALKTATRQSDIQAILNNKAYIFEKQNLWQKALDIYRTLYHNSIKQNDSSKTARYLDNLSFLKSQMSLPDAEEGLLQALQIHVKENHKMGTATSYMHLLKHYQKNDDTLKMTLYSDTLIEISKKTANIEIKEIALKLKLEVSNSPFIKKYLNFTDSINLAKDIRRNQFNYYVYQYEAKEKDLNKSKLQNERLLYLIIAIGLIFVALYFILKYKHKKEKIQQVYHTEVRISRKIHDEVANDVYHVMTKLQDQSEENKTLLDDLENIYNRTRDISKENSSIDVSTNYQDLLIDLFLSYNSKDVNVMTKDLHRIDWNQLNDVKKSTMYRIFQELLTNMKKHSKATAVVFNFGQEHKKIIINYKDNGIGSDLKKGNGLQNTVNRMESINGTITFESEVQKGFKVLITI